MKHTFRRGAAALLTLGMVALAAPGVADEAPPGSESNPIVVTDPSEVPDGAVTIGPVKDAVTCETSQEWRLEIPAIDETSHAEARFKRTVPAVAEESHLLYAYSRTTPAVEGVKEYLFERQVNVYKTEYRGTYQKHVQGKVEKREKGVFGWGSWKNAGTFGWEPYGPGGIWGGSGSYQTGPWSFDRPAEVLQQGGHNDTSAVYDASSKVEYRKVSQQYRYVLTGTETNEKVVGTQPERSTWRTDPLPAPWRQIDERWKVEPRPERTDLSGEVTEPRDAPWVLLDGYPRKVVDVEAVPAYDEFYVLGGEPSRDEDDASWLPEAQYPGAGWTQFDERTVKHGDGVPARTVHYVWSDGVTCPPTEEPPTEEPPTEQPPTEQPPVTDTPAPPADTPAPPTVGEPTPPPIEEPPAKRTTPTPDVPTRIDAGLAGGAAADNDGDTVRALAGTAAVLTVVAGVAWAARRVSRRP